MSILTVFIQYLFKIVKRIFKICIFSIIYFDIDNISIGFVKFFV